MIYNVYANNQQGFVQFVSLPERDDVGATVVSAQQRMTHSSLETLVRLIIQSSGESNSIAKKLHDDNDAYRKFHGGFVLSDSDGDTLIAVINRRAAISVVVNTVVVVTDVRDVKKFVQAIANAAFE